MLNKKCFTTTTVKKQKKRLFRAMFGMYGTSKFDGFKSIKHRQLFKAAVKSIAAKAKKFHSLGKAMEYVRNTLRYFDTAKYSKNELLLEQFVFAYTMAVWAFYHKVSVKAIFYASEKLANVTSQYKINKLKAKSKAFRNKFFDAGIARYAREYKELVA